MSVAIGKVFGSALIDTRSLAASAAAALIILPVTWLEERWRVRRLRYPWKLLTRSGESPGGRRRAAGVASISHSEGGQQ